MPPVNLRFGRAKLNSPSELVSRVNAALNSLRDAKNERTKDKAMEDVARYLEQIKTTVVGIDDQPPKREVAIELNREAIEHELVAQLLLRLKEFEFETRKDVGVVVGAFLRIKMGDAYPMADYVARHEAILTSLVDRYSDHTDPHLGLIAGGILRDCIRHEQLAKRVAESSLLLQLFDDVDESKFEIAADSFATFREVIVRHKGMMGQVLERRFDEFFPKLNALIQSDNFFIRRQTLKLLSEILLEPENHAVAAQYVRDVQNLIMLMNLLRDKYDSIQFEAFHSFKVFLIGDDKAPEVLDILQKNKQKLLQFFENFQNEKAEADESFGEEKDYVCEMIKKIPD